MQMTTFFPTLQRGEAGNSVVRLQRLLNEQFAGNPRAGIIERLEPDGIYGAKTEKAVRIAQYRYLLFADGIASDQTQRSLRLERTLIEEFPTLRRGDRGPSVIVVQTTLDPTKVGPADGIFGARTEAAVKDYQLSSHLVADGIVGEKTWQALEHRALAQLV